MLWNGGRSRFLCLLALWMSLLVGTWMLLSARPALADGELIESVDFEHDQYSTWLSEDLNRRFGRDYWGLSDRRAFSGNYSLYCAGHSDASPGRYDRYEMAAFHKVFDLRNAGCTALSYWYYLDVPFNQGRDYFKVAYRRVGENAYHTLLVQQGVSNGWIHMTHKLPSELLEVIFYFTSDSTSVTAEGVYVDDIQLRTFDNFFVCYLADSFVSGKQDINGDGRAEAFTVRTWTGSSDVARHYVDCELTCPDTGQSWWVDDFAFEGGKGYLEFNLDRQDLDLDEDQPIRLDLKLYNADRSVLWDEHDVLLEAPVMMNRPLRVSLVRPSSGQLLSGVQTFEWQGGDSPAFTPQVSLEFSADGGQTWLERASHLPLSGTCEVDLGSLPAEFQGKELAACIIVSDERDTVVSNIVHFGSDCEAPRVLAASPPDGATEVCCKPKVHFEVRDDFAIDTASVKLFVDGDQVAFEADFADDVLTLDWQPIAPFAHSHRVEIELHVTDTASPPNALVYRSSFTTVSVNSPPRIDGPGEINAEAGDEVEFDLQVSDPDCDDVTFSVTGLPDGANVNNAYHFDWPTTSSDAGTYVVHFSAADAYGGEGTLDTTLQIASSGPPPLSGVSIAPETPDTTTPLTATAEGLPDPVPEGLELLWQWYVLHDGSESFEALDGQTSDTLSADYFVRGDVVKVTCAPRLNGQTGETVEASVTIGNAPPPTPSPHIKPDAPTTYSNLYCSALSVDPDGDRVTYLAQWYKSIDGGATFQLVEGQTSKALSKYLTAKHEIWRCEIAATDGELTSAIASDQVEILNTPPKLLAMADVQAVVGDVVVLDATGKDADGDSLLYAVTPRPEGATFNEQNGKLTWDTAGADAGDYFFTFSVSDDDGATASTTVNVQLSKPENSKLTALALSPSAPTCLDDLHAEVTVADGVDPASLEYSYAWYVKEPGADDWTLLEGEESDTLSAGNCHKGDQVKCECKAWDGNSWSSPVSDTVTVVNAPPPTPSPHIKPDNPTTYSNLYCSALSVDPDGDRVTYLAQWYKSVDGGATFQLVEGQTSKALSKYLTTKHEIWRCEIAATDGELTSAIASDQVEILNTPPRLLDVADQSIKVGDTLAFTLVGKDADGDELSYSCANLPAGATLDSTTGRFIWTPSEGQEGDYSLQFSVSDDDGATAETTVKVEVTAAE